MVYSLFIIKITDSSVLDSKRTKGLGLIDSLEKLLHSLFLTVDYDAFSYRADLDAQDSIYKSIVQFP